MRPVVARTTFVSGRVGTVADVEQMPEGFRYEIVDGVLYMAAPPVWPHPLIVANLHAAVSPWVRARRLGHFLPSRTGIYLDECNYLDPNQLFVRKSQLPRHDERISTATIAVEVLSPSDVRVPREDRETLARQAGVPELWYVHPDTRSLEVRRLGADGYETVSHFRSDDRVTWAELPGLEFPLPALWEDLGE